MAHFREAARIAPGFVEAHYNMGILMARQGGHEEAAAHFRDALRFSPGNPDIEGQLAAAMARSRR